MSIGWKLRRELGRLRQQLAALASRPLDPWRSRRHDREFATRCQVEAGEPPAGAKVAILLIWQPKGIAASTALSLRHLRDAGWSVLLVSNAPLSAQDREGLRASCWKIVERPNFGYDFGGYRDGIRALRESGHKASQLLLLNDSFWWPLFADDDLLLRLEGLGRDMAGVIGHARADGDFIESWMMLFSGRALADPAFDAFWQGYLLSDIKRNAVKRGERRLAPALAVAGLSTGSLVDTAGIQALLERLSSADLADVLRHGAFIDDSFQQRAARLVAVDMHDAAWREAALALCRDILARRNPHVSLPLATMRHMGVDVMKKASAQAQESLEQVMRRVVIGAVDSGRLPEFLPAPGREIRAIATKGARPGANPSAG